MNKPSSLEKSLQVARLIMWDKTLMSSKQVIEAFDRMLHDIIEFDILFSGKVIVFGGDFHQVLPIMCMDTREHHIDAS